MLLLYLKELIDPEGVEVLIKAAFLLREVLMSLRPIPPRVPSWYQLDHNLEHFP